MGTLTVRENLHFSAALRLPSNMSWRQRKDRVEKVIDELGLHLCANTKVHNYEVLYIYSTIVMVCNCRSPDWYKVFSWCIRW